MERGPFDVVVPTLGRDSLRALLEALADARGPAPGRVLLVADGVALGSEVVPRALAPRVEVLRGPGRGPAAARNVGWRASNARWIAFLDDDVVPAADWLERLAEDLGALPDDVAGSQGRIVVPLRPDRRPTDWERDVEGLERARWATADMAYRRDALVRVGGFDERFPHAYREDADLALRLVAAGYRLVSGSRTALHPVPPADPWVSMRRQRGNADDALMSALHGPRWHGKAGAPRGRRALHLATSAAAVVGVAGALAGRRRLATLGAAGWLASTAELAWRRIAPGPRTRAEIATMLATSAAIPAAATFHWLAGLARRRRLLADTARAPRPVPDAVLLDRDGTLVADVPYNGDPERVVPIPGVREALDRLRSAGVRTAVVSNQSGVGRGLLTFEQVEAVNRRVEELLGPLGPWLVCPHRPDDGCDCRKPAPRLVLDAAAALGVAPERCAFVGDIGSDVEAARAAGARAMLVPTPATRPEEVAAAPEVARNLGEAVDRLIGATP